MSKQYKKQQQAVIPLAKGYGLIVPQHSDNKEIMIAIGMLVQIWGLAEIEHGLDIETFKKMLCAYADKILDVVDNDKVKTDPVIKKEVE